MSKELRAVVGVVVLGGRALGVAMEMMVRRRDRLGLERCRVDAKDVRFLMVEPHDRVTSFHARPQSKPRANCLDLEPRRETPLRRCARARLAQDLRLTAPFAFKNHSNSERAARRSDMLAAP